jgi:hypothetical protein
MTHGIALNVDPSVTFLEFLHPAPIRVPEEFKVQGIAGYHGNLVTCGDQVRRNALEVQFRATPGGIVSLDQVQNSHKTGAQQKASLSTRFYQSLALPSKTGDNSLRRSAGQLW